MLELLDKEFKLSIINTLTCITKKLDNINKKEILEESETIE